MPRVWGIGALTSPSSVPLENWNKQNWMKLLNFENMSLFGEMNIVHLKTEFFQDLVGQNLTANFAIGDGYKIKVSNLT